jgi:hypothetical protein
MKDFTTEQIKKTIQEKGYGWFENGDYNLNIVGVRNSETKNKVTNLFDDVIYLIFKINGSQLNISYPITTDPGTKWILKHNVKGGFARLVPGQYRGVYMIDLHLGKYEALCQRNGNVKTFRDINRDMLYDENTITSGMYGINIHKAGSDSSLVNDWSCGCQVFKRVKDFDAFMSICRKAAKIHGNKFSYTLLESTDIS